ncbi:Os06g0336200 [Oryza sativa Japonica Group]|uniref:Os06g0336200 protein n=1 Tax=Oryza sativa subsp. japonica TaxID=39947 RepID=A0A0P0WWJ8_ORYSJ|nr:Os06g0336200 [Oryza sativa Japonica Group]
MSGNIAFGRFDDSFSAASLKAYVAEFISTLVFVFAGVGSAIAYTKLTGGAPLDPARSPSSPASSTGSPSSSAPSSAPSSSSSAPAWRHRRTGCPAWARSRAW